MKLNFFENSLSNVKRLMATTLLCLAAVVFFWQGAFFSNVSAMADSANLIASKDVADQIQEKVSKDAGRAKNFIQDTKDKVEQTANKNAAKVDRATDDNGSFVERKANRDKARIEQKAEKDAARTEKAVDNTKNAVERTVDNIKDAFNK